MTQVVTVHTDFTDLNQMAQGLIGRVDPVKVILPGPEPVDAGEWVQFAVTLLDGTPGFAGVGRCVTAVDNGEERSSHQRFDVVIDSLQFDPRGQQVFEHILLLSGYEGEGEPAGAQADDYAYGGADDDQAYEDVSAQEVPTGAYYEAQGVEMMSGGQYGAVATEFTGSAIEVPADALEEVRAAEAANDDYAEDEATMIGESPDLAGMEDDDRATVPPTAQAAAVAPFAGQDDIEEGAFELEVPTGAVDMLSAPPRMPSTARSNGAVFSYPDGLPFPEKPPRPALDPSMRVSPAPRPQAGKDEHD